MPQFTARRQSQMKHARPHLHDLPDLLLLDERLELAGGLTVGGQAGAERDGHGDHDDAATATHASRQRERVHLAFPEGSKQTQELIVSL